jgi:hypothetical protein
MHEPAACGARAAQHSKWQVLLAETEASGTAVHVNAAASKTATAMRARAAGRFEILSVME